MDHCDVRDFLGLDVFGCTTYFFKSHDAFSSYTPLEKAAGQSSKEGTNLQFLGWERCKWRSFITDSSIGGQKARFFKDKKEVFSGILKNGLYLIGGSFITSIPTALTAWSLQSPGDITLWHRRFGHFGIGKIVEASKLVSGLEITIQDVIGRCEDCIIGNQKRRPYDEDIIPETEVLRLTNINIWGE